MFICGSKGFSHEKDEDKYSTYDSPCQTAKAKRSKTSTSFRKFLGNSAKIKNNPYADKGLDKFYELLAELDKQKQQIYTEKGSEDISFMRFAYNNDSKHVKPIAVRVDSPRNSFVDEHSNKIHSTVPKCNDVVKVVDRKEEVVKRSGAKKRCNERRFRLSNLRRPQYYFCMMIVLILVFLCMNDRSFAILFTLIGWYLCPTIIGERSSSTRKPKRKKEYHVKNQSEKIVTY